MDDIQGSMGGSASILTQKPKLPAVFFELYNWLHRHPAPYFLFSRAGSHLGAQKLIPQNQVALDQPMTHFAARRAEDASFWIMVLDDCRRVDR